MSGAILCAWRRRQARTDTISPEELQVGSPAFLKEDPTFGQHYYIAALVPLVSEPPQDPAALTPQLIPTCVGPRYARPGKHFACLPSSGPFEGLLLGSLVGRGSFGRVYRGLWKGQVVGVKVCLPLLPPALGAIPSLLPSLPSGDPTMSLHQKPAIGHGLVFPK